MRILAVSTVWRRPDVTAAFLDSLAAQQPPAGWDLDVLICGSEGEKSRGPVAERGFRYVEHRNMPLGAKHNALLRAARELEWDYLWLLGSDTLLTPGFLEYYRAPVDDGALRIGLRDCWFWDCAGRRLLYFAGYGTRRSDSVGAGRLFHRVVVERANWQLWDNDISVALDWSTTERLNGLGTRERLGYQSRHDARGFLLELRTADNVTGLEDFRHGELVETIIPPEVVALLERTPWRLGGKAATA